MKSTLPWHLSELTTLFLVWANLVTSTDLTAVLTLSHSHITNSHHLLQLLWETEGHFWALPANHGKHSHACFFAPLWADVAQILQQLILSSNLTIKCVGMTSMTQLLFQKFRNWSNDNLQGQPGKLFQHFRPFCSWKAATTWLIFNRDLTFLQWLNHSYTCILP